MSSDETPIHSVKDLIHSIIKNVDKTVELIKENQEYQTVRRYDTRMDYSMGFWDGFFYGATLISTLSFGMIYYLK
jgi:predicted nucleic acid-binding protein